MSPYGLGLVCLNGHKIEGNASIDPSKNPKRCSKCGDETITQCPTCKTAILGSRGFSWEPAAYCHECGSPYPWTERRQKALAEAVEFAADELSAEERNALKQSIPNLLAETPQTQVAAARFKKAIDKAGAFGGKVIADTVSKVCVEAAKQYFGF